MTTFDLADAVLASMEPTVETDPAVLRRWASNLDRAAAAYAVRGQIALATRKSNRAQHLRALADREEGAQICASLARQSEFYASTDGGYRLDARPDEVSA